MLSIPVRGEDFRNIFVLLLENNYFEEFSERKALIVHTVCANFGLNVHTVCTNFGLNVHTVCTNFGLIVHTPVYKIKIRKCMCTFCLCSLLYIQSVKSCHGCCSKTALKCSAAMHSAAIQGVRKSAATMLWEIPSLTKQLLMLQQLEAASVTAWSCFKWRLYVQLRTETKCAHTFSNISIL